MRKHAAVLVLIVASLFLSPCWASAQGRHPEAMDLAFGLDLGLYVPSEELHAGFMTQGLIEFYLIHNISVRGTVGWSQNGFQGTSGQDLEQTRGTFGLVFNWEKELWHPFVTVGGGYYGLRSDSGQIEDPDWVHRWGVNFGGGVEYFSRPTWTIKIEGTYHWVDENRPISHANGFALTAGLKKYF